MSIFSNIFGSGGSNAVPPNSDTNGGPNPNNPTAAPTQAPTPAPSGLDQFKDVWNAPSAEEVAAKNKPMFDIDPAKVTEAAATIYFTKMLKPEVIAAMATGGEEGVRASMGAMNAMVQSVYAQNAMATTKIVEEAVKKAKQEFSSELPSLVKRTQLNDNLLQDNPALSHPAAQPIISALQTQLSQKFPQATARELQEMAMNYMTSFADVVKPTPNKEMAIPKGEDWDKFFDPNQVV